MLTKAYESQKAPYELKAVAPNVLLCAQGVRSVSGNFGQTAVKSNIPDGEFPH